MLAVEIGPVAGFAASQFAAVIGAVDQRTSCLAAVPKTESSPAGAQATVRDVSVAAHLRTLATAPGRVRSWSGSAVPTAKFDGADQAPSVSAARRRKA